MMFTPVILLALHVLQARADDGDRSRHLSSDDFARGAAIVPYTLPWWHPEIQYIATNRIAGPSDHPLLDDDREFQRFIRANTGESHRFLDGRRGYIQRPWGLPGGHPNCDNYFIYEEFPEADLPIVYFDHPDINDAYANGEQLPDGHPSVSGLLQKVLPEGHPDVDDLFLDHEELPEWHPDLNLVVQDNPIEPIYVFSGHPDLNDEEEMGEPIDHHPTVHHLFADHIPDSHPNIDDLMFEGFTLPSWHPKLGSIVRTRPWSTSPGFLLCAGVAALSIVFCVARVLTKCKNSRTEEIVVTKSTATNTTIGSSCSDETSSSQDGSVEAVMRRDNAQSYVNQHEERILVYKEKKSNWKKVFGKRVAKTNNSTGELMLCLLYVSVNAAALLASPDYAFGVGFGSLSAGNTVFVFLTAARNSFFTWFLGVAFDQVLVYHRFIGRLTVALALAHSWFYIDDVLSKTTDYITLTGLVCLGCGLVIVLSSLNFIRRKFFNIFFWLHCGSFLGFVFALYLHASSARPYVLAAIGCYVLDKGVQLLRKMPKKTTIFENVDDRTARVRFSKGPLSTLLGRHEVGQYVFVNFPSLSLQEWHPFSIASAPSAPYMDIYIRTLGDHTKKIVEYSERCAAEKKQARIRVDGPYGTLPFNINRYASLLLVGGGIGITPIIGILHELFGHRGGERKRKATPSSRIKCVSVVWIMPHAADAALFLDLLNSFRVTSLEDPTVPDLDLSIHATRESGGGGAADVEQTIAYSRPRFDDVLRGIMDSNEPEGASSSLLVYACGPGKMVRQLWDASMKKRSRELRVDFYHENFEF